MPKPILDRTTIAESIRACHTRGLVTDRAVGQALGVSGSTIAYWRHKLGIPVQEIAAAHWEQRHGAGSYAELLRFIALGAESRVIRQRYGISRQYVHILRQRYRLSPPR